MTGAPLVGRERELATLLAALARLRRGHAGCVAITGEAGIGKTRLLDEFAAHVDPRRELVLIGRAAEFEQQVPFALAIDALDGYLATIEPRLLARIGEERQAEIGVVFPSLAAPGAVSIGTQAERYRWHHAVRALLEEIAVERPLVLALDDVHWSDETSVELLAHLMRRRLQKPVLLLVAYRPQGAPALLLKAVDKAVRDERLALVELEPLAFEHADEFLGGIDPAMRAALFDESGGNPFYLEQLARAPVADARRHAALLGSESEDGADVPAAVRASLAQEVDRVPPQARILLRAAAVVGEPFEPGITAEVAELGEADALEALDELIAVGLVRRTDAPRSFAFRHPIVSRAIYASIGGGWALAAHERAARALAARGEPALVIAHHLERSARPGDQRAIDQLRQAGDLAAPRAPSTAARCYRAALRLLPEIDAGEQQRLELLMALAASLISSGRLDESSVVLHDALALLHERSGRRVGVVTLLAQTEVFLGRHGEARRLLSDALEVLSPGPSRERAALSFELAVDDLRGGDWDGAARWGVEALTAAQRTSDGAMQAAAAGLLGLTDYARGFVPAARERAAAGAEIIDRLSNRGLAGKLVSTFFVACAELELGEIDRALAHGDRGLTVARATGQALLVAPLTFVIARAYLCAGRLDESAATAVALVDQARLLAIDQQLAWAWSLRACVAVHRGDVTAALPAAERGAAHARAAPHGLFSHHAHRILAEARIVSGQPDVGRDYLLTQCGGPELSMIEVGSRAHWYEMLAQAELALGCLEDARSWVERAQRSADLPSQRAFADRADAAVLLAEGRYAEAADAATSAANTFGSVGRQEEAARALVLLGRALASLGAREGAITALETAHRELDACGAGRARDEAARELRRLERRVPGPQRRGDARQGVAGLSGREREVAELIARGHTNRQMAGALFLSERTIENHVSHIFQKLGVSRRTEIAREIGRVAEGA